MVRDKPLGQLVLLKRSSVEFGSFQPEQSCTAGLEGAGCGSLALQGSVRSLLWMGECG